MERFSVELDGESFAFFPGARVRDLIGRLGPESQIAIANGLAYVSDRYGNRLGEDGALHPGGVYSLVRVA